MPRRGRKRAIKLKIRKDTLQSVLSIVLIAAAGISLISFLAPNYTVNEKIQQVLRLMFGSVSFVFPFILLVGGLILIRSLKWKFVDVRSLLGLAGIQLSLAGLVHIFYSAEKAGELAQNGQGGGIIGHQLSSILENLISLPGGVLFLLAFAGVSVIFGLDVTIDELLEFSKKALEKVKSIKTRKAEGEESEDDEEDNMDISSGELPADEWETKEKEKELKPSFEVVPSLSEPQAGKAVQQQMDSSEVVSLASGLPYSDKVWEPPPLDLLEDAKGPSADRGNVKAREKIIQETLQSFGIDVKIDDVQYGPSVTQYALKAESGTKIAKISSLQNDLALALASPTGSVRIEAPIPGRSAIGIEVPNTTRDVVPFKELITSDPMKQVKSKLAVVLGKDVGGQPHIYDISKMPHLLVAGATGSGKSVFLHSLLFSILYRCSPAECKFILVDPKRVELVHYADIPYLLTPVVTDVEKSASVFRWAIQEMERRYKLLEAAKVRNIDAYNEKSGFQALPYILIVVDEMAEIMVVDPAEVEKSIIRLAQLARATGIHLILTVQRPSTNVITGLIKANIPCRAAFNVTSQVDSRVIIDQPGAEKLLGKGDMLFVPPDASKPKRIQGAMVSDREINQVVNYLKNEWSEPDYKEEILEQVEKEKSVTLGGDSTDELFDDAVDIVVSAGKASASLLQRRLSIGYARAARILDELQAKGIVGPSRGSKAREVLIDTFTEAGLDDEAEVDPDNAVLNSPEDDY